MTDRNVRQGHLYERTNVSDSASIHQGDRYHIQNATFHLPATPHMQDIGWIESSTRLIANHEITENIPPSGRGVALLALDGVGASGMYSLYMLKHFMERVARAKNLKCVPKPCQFFNMIGGSGIGAIIAVLLGRLEMTIEDCIGKYGYLIAQIVTRHGVTLDCVDTGQEITSGSSISPDTVKDIFGCILRETGLNEDMLFQAPSFAQCKVCIRSHRNADNGSIVLNTYAQQALDICDTGSLKIWELVYQILSDLELSRDDTDGHSKSQKFHMSTQFDSDILQLLCTEAQMTLIDDGQSLDDHTDTILYVGNSLMTTLSRHANLDEVGENRLNKCIRIQVFEEFCQQHPASNMSDNLCCLRVDDVGEAKFKIQDRNHISIRTAVESYMNKPDQLEQMMMHIKRAADHLVSPYFALTHAPNISNSLSVDRNQRKLLPFIERVSDYNARIAHWRLSHPRVRGTCTWIFKNKQFKMWHTASDTSVLACIGTVGCGKSFLAAAVIDHIKELNLSGNRICFHYFFDVQKKSTSPLSDMLRAFIKQIYMSCKRGFSVLPAELETALYDTFKPRTQLPSIDDLTFHLNKLLSTTPKALYLIDGYDDLDEIQMQKFFIVLRATFSKHNSHGSKLALFSRETLGKGIDIDKQLSVLPAVNILRLRLEHLRSDISKYVEAQVTDQELKKTISMNKNLVEEIKIKLKEHSDKMFLWIQLQITTIWDLSDSINDDEVRKLIEDLPLGLDETYARCLMRIDRQTSRHCEIAVRAFKWVANAKRPLSLREVREAVSIEVDNLPLPESQILNTNVTDYCSNLLTTDIASGSVKFSHPTVRQFLEKQDLLQGSLSKYHLRSDFDSHWCGQICLSYIKMLHQRKQVVRYHKAHISGDVATAFLQTVPLASAVNSISRLLLARPTRASNLSFPVAYRAHVQAELELTSYILRHWLDHNSDITISSPNYSLLATLCASPLPEYFPWLDHTGINGDFYSQIVYYAIMQNNAAILQALMSRKSNRTKEVLNQPWPDTTTYLIHMASALGFTSVVRVLLNVCAIDIRDLEGKTPLAWAAENSHIETIMLLLDRGAEPKECFMFKPKLEHKTMNHAYYSMGLVSILAHRAAPSAFVFILNTDTKYLGCLHHHECLSQALFGACISGNDQVAAQLKELGADPHQSSLFHFPGRQQGISGDLLEYSFYHDEYEAARILISLAPVGDERAHADFLRGFFKLPGPSALKLQKFLCSAGSSLFFRRNLRYDWEAMIVQTFAYHGNSDWRQVIRNVLPLLLGHEGQHKTFEQKFILDAKTRSDYGQTIFASPRLPDDILAVFINNQDNPIMNHIRFDATVFVYDDTHKHYFIGLIQRPSCRLVAKFINTISDLSSPGFQFLYEYTFLHKLLAIGTNSAVELLLLASSGIHKGFGLQSFIRRRTSFQALLNKFGIASIETITDFQVKIAETGLKTPKSHVAFRCLRQCKGVDAATRMYIDLLQISPDFDLSLNFPAGYSKSGAGWNVSATITNALYRWNWRLRRCRDLPLSAADLLYYETMPAFGMTTFSKWPAHSKFKRLLDARLAFEPEITPSNHRLSAEADVTANVSFSGESNSMPVGMASSAHTDGLLGVLSNVLSKSSLQREMKSVGPSTQEMFRVQDFESSELESLKSTYSNRYV